MLLWTALVETSGGVTRGLCGGLNLTTMLQKSINRVSGKIVNFLNEQGLLGSRSVDAPPIVSKGEAKEAD